MARPKKPPGTAKHARLDIRATESEIAAYRQAAEAAGMVYADWIRQALNKAAKKQEGVKP